MMHPIRDDAQTGNGYALVIDTPTPGILSLCLVDADEREIDRVECAFFGPVDNILLTAVDNLIKRSTLDRSALVSVRLGAGIDKSSSLHRIVTSFAAAVAVSRHAVAG